MRASSLESKTIRPGTIGAYSYYHSARAASPAHPAFIATSRRKLLPLKLLATVLVVAALVGIPLLRADTPTHKAATTTQKTQKSTGAVPPTSAAAIVPATKGVNHCGANTLNKLALVIVSQRHMWACEGNKTVYDAPVITGITTHAETLTPPGTYHIYSKTTDTTLTGSDSTGSWSDPVSYWMPFLDNQYGTYGFHDATWRANSAFGNVDPNSSDASHGCVELPLDASAWLYNWAPVGTTVTIES